MPRTPNSGAYFGAMPANPLQVLAHGAQQTAGGILEADLRQKQQAQADEDRMIRAALRDIELATNGRLRDVTGEGGAGGVGASLPSYTPGLDFKPDLSLSPGGGSAPAPFSISSTFGQAGGSADSARPRLNPGAYLTGGIGAKGAPAPMGTGSDVVAPPRKSLGVGALLRGGLEGELAAPDGGTRPMPSGDFGRFSAPLSGAAPPSSGGQRVQVGAKTYEVRPDPAGEQLREKVARVVEALRSVGRKDADTLGPIAASDPSLLRELITPKAAEPVRWEVVTTAGGMWERHPHTGETRPLKVGGQQAQPRPRVRDGQGGTREPTPSAALNYTQDLAEEVVRSVLADPNVLEFGPEEILNRASNLAADANKIPGARDAWKSGRLTRAHLQAALGRGRGTQRAEPTKKDQRRANFEKVLGPALSDLHDQILDDLADNMTPAQIERDMVADGVPEQQVKAARLYMAKLRGQVR